MDTMRFLLRHAPKGTYGGTRASYSTLPRLPDTALARFQTDAFIPARPHSFPAGTLRSLPAIEKWFISSPETGQSALATDYLSKFASTMVPVEISYKGAFTRVDEPLATFLATLEHPVASVYVAQAPISDLPAELQADLPTPELVLKVGKGDVYDSSIWLGQAPTYTPLHRDPNPNFFVQLAGRKHVRLLPPDVGAAVFADVQRQIGGSASANMRGEEMMSGEEKTVLEQAIWGDDKDAQPWQEHGYECQLMAGDGLFIPKGWWHSVKGIGQLVVPMKRHGTSTWFVNPISYLKGFDWTRTSIGQPQFSWTQRYVGDQAAPRPMIRPGTSSPAFPITTLASRLEEAWQDLTAELGHA